MMPKERPIPNPNLRDFWLTREINGYRVRFRILYGGRDSSKSWDAAARAAWLAHQGNLRFLCTRMFQNRIRDSVYETIKKQAERFGWDKHFEFQNTGIYTDTGSEFLFYGLSRNIKEVKSLEGIDVLWIEEGQSLTEDMWDILEPTIRKDGSEIWIVFNPHLQQDFIWQEFVVDPPKNALVRKINYNENPFLSETSLQTIQRRKKEDYDSYEHIYLGVPKEDDEAVIIKRKWIEAAVDAHKKLGVSVSGSKKLGYDPADGNEEGTADNNAIAARYGILVQDTEEWKAGEDELMKSTKRAYNRAANGYSIVYDPIGVGAGVGSKTNELNEERGLSISHSSFNAGGSVIDPDKEYKDTGIKNKDYFSNLKAQAWWLLADRFRNTYNAIERNESHDGNIISISSDCNNLEKLIAELSAPKRDYDYSGRLKVEKKADMLKRGIKSPNLADSVVMCFAPTKKKTKLRVSMA